MRKRARVAELVAAFAIFICMRTDTHGQEWSVDASVGRLVYDPALVNAATDNLMGALRYDTRGDAWVYGAVAPPFGGDDTFWGAAGTGGRFVPTRLRRHPVSVGADLAAQGFSFRDAVTRQVGKGGTLDAMPFARFVAGAGFTEVRGGWRGYTLSLADTRARRGVFEAGARTGYGTIFRIEGDARWVHATEGTYPFVGATLVYDGAPVQVWGQTGKWLHSDVNEVTWAAGVGVTLGPRATFWANMHQEAPEPLYWNTTRRTWSLGITRRFGRAPSTRLSPLRSQDGPVVIRLRLSEAPAGTVTIGGDFNNWQPAPMQREGDAWIARLPLKAGVYHYAFRSATGAWFVPASAAGRRDDGMGGHVAVMVVN